MMMTRFAQLLDVLHVMAGEHGDDAMLGIVEAQKFAHAFLADDIEADRRFIEK